MWKKAKVQSFLRRRPSHFDDDDEDDDGGRIEGTAATNPLRYKQLPEGVRREEEEEDDEKEEEDEEEKYPQEEYTAGHRERDHRKGVPAGNRKRDLRTQRLRSRESRHHDPQVGRLKHLPLTSLLLSLLSSLLSSSSSSYYSD